MKRDLLVAKWAQKCKIYVTSLVPLVHSFSFSFRFLVFIFSTDLVCRIFKLSISTLWGSLDQGPHKLQMQAAAHSDILQESESGFSTLISEYNQSSVWPWNVISGGPENAIQLWDLWKSVLNQPEF